MDTPPLLKSKETVKTNVFRGGGAMGDLMRNYNWDSHPLGNPELWPQSLKSNIMLMLNSSFPMFIWWTRDLYIFYNDAYIPALGNKHPDALGAKATNVWSEIWKDIGGITEEVLSSGEQFYTANMQLYLQRNGYSEETFWTFSYSPAFNDAGEVEGMFCACHEITETILNQRRIKTLKEISDAVTQSLEMEQAGEAVCGILDANKQDIPFSLIYLYDSSTNQANLIGHGGEIDSALRPDNINVNGQDVIWKLDQVNGSKTSIVVNVQTNTTHQTNREAATRAAVLPIIKPGINNIIGFLVVGLSPNLNYTEDYKGFHSLLSGHIATFINSIANKQLLVKQQLYLNDIFQQAPVGIAVLKGPEYIVDIANPEACEIWGVEQKEVLGKPVLETVSPSSRETLKTLLDTVYQTGVPHSANELPLALNREGKQETVYLNIVYHPLQDEDGKIVGINTIGIDISEQVSSRKLIEQSESRLQGIIGATPECIKIISPDGTLEFMNPSGLEMIEGDDCLLGKASVLDLIAPENKTTWIKNHKLVCQGQSMNWEFDIIGLKGTRRRMETHAVPIPSSKGTAQLAVTRDITERKKYEETLQQKNEQLVRINNDLDNFIYTASHDLKAPISNIEGLLALLSDDLEEGRINEQETKHVIKLMQGSVDRFKNTISSLTDVVKLQQENNSETVLVDLQKVLKNVSLDLEPKIKDTNATLLVHVQDNKLIKFTEKNLRSILYNLLSNSIKYSSPDREPVINIQVQENETHNILLVSDNGLGIASSHIQELFTMFRRFHDHVEGTGIGLYMVKKMVENAGGKIEVDSQVGVGTTFKIYFKK